MADNFNMKQFLAENKLGAYSKLKEEKFYAPSYVAKKYGNKAKEIEDNIHDEEDSNPNIWDLYTSLETEKETDEFVKGFMNEGELEEVDVRPFDYSELPTKQYEKNAVKAQDIINFVKKYPGITTKELALKAYGTRYNYSDSKERILQGAVYMIDRVVRAGKIVKVKDIKIGKTTYTYFTPEDYEEFLQKKKSMNIGQISMKEGENQYYVHDKEGMEEPEGPFTLDQAKQELAKLGPDYKMIDAKTAKEIWSHLEDDMNEGDDEDKLPLTPKMKKFIDKVISDAKKDGEFEELVQVDYFENDLIDFILEKFDEEGNYDNVSQEVKDYINKSVKDYYRNPDGTPFFSEDLGRDRTDAEAEKMMDFLAEKDKTEEAIDAKSFGGILKSDNPEGDALVLRFLQGIAKKFEYPVSHAAMFVKERIKKLGY